MLIKRYELNEMKPWDLSYYSEKYKEEEFGFNIKEFNRYFEYEPFLNRYVKFLEDMYNVKLERFE